MHKLIVGCAAVAVAGPAFGHHTAGEGAGALEALLAALMLVGAILYASGVRALWRRAGAGRAIAREHVLLFALGWTALAAALLSPIDAYADRSFALHMVQHEVLMVIAAPLIVLGRPLEAFAWGSPRRLTQAFRWLARTQPVQKLWLLLTGSLSAWIVHAAVIWIWHLPVLFKAALASLPLHMLQHTCFLVTALGFWWSAVGARERMPGSASVASLFTTMLHTSALGALLTFAPTAWYALESPAFGLSAVEDQQLGGLVMWIPGGMAYMIAGLSVVRAWLDPKLS
jgi:putative membrane protein